MIFWIAYDGRKYHGFNIQPNVRTIEGEIFRVLKELEYIDDWKSAGFRRASRTDKKVSALMNIIKVNIKKEVDLNKINERLEDIYFIAYCEKDFDVRKCSWKMYKYFVKKDDLDFEGMKKIAKIFEGEKDFWGFCKPYREDMNTIRRVLKVEVKKWRDYIVIDIVAERFLWQMARRIANAIILYGKGKVSEKEIFEAFERKRKFDPAPPENLVLWFIKYPFEIEWKLDENLEKELKSLQIS